MKKTRKQLIAKWEKRSFSWSQYSSWDFGKKKWAEKYLFNEAFIASEVMMFGNVVGDTLGLGEKLSMVPKLEKHLCGEKEFPLEVKMNDFKLIGYADQWCPETLHLNENKTSLKADRWTQAAVDKHDQLTMYGLILYLKFKIDPGDIKMFLNFVPTFQGTCQPISLPTPVTFKRFETKRTKMQCLAFGAKLKARRDEMRAYAQVIDIPA